MKKILLGTGQFLGVNHMSRKKGVERANYFLDVKNVIDTIKCAKEVGFEGMMISTHVHAKKILTELAKDSNLSSDFRVYPNLPYMQKYVTGANEKGMFGFVMEMIKGAGFKSIIRGTRGHLTKNVNELLKILIDLELSIYSNVKMGPVFLHNSLTDLALSLNLEEIFKFYVEYIESQYGVPGAFVTLNFVKLAKYFDKIGIKKPIIQAPFNKIGFQMNPSLSENIKTLEKFDGTFIAMTTLAAGYLKSDEAYRFLSSLPNIDSIIVGASTKKHINETYNSILKYG
jgi:hypothetical protein